MSIGYNTIKQLSNSVTSEDLALSLGVQHSKLKNSIENTFARVGYQLETIMLPALCKPINALVLTNDVMRIYKKGQHYEWYKEIAEKRGITNEQQLSHNIIQQHEIPLERIQRISPKAEAEEEINIYEYNRLKQSKQRAVLAMNTLKKIYNDQKKFPLGPDDGVGSYRRYEIIEVMSMIEDAAK